MDTRNGQTMSPKDTTQLSWEEWHKESRKQWEKGDELLDFTPEEEQRIMAALRREEARRQIRERLRKTT